MDKSIPDIPTDALIADIATLRNVIDGIDEKILDLINQRLLLAKQIGGLKKKAGIQITDSARENEITRRLLNINRGPLSDDGLNNIFAAIITEGRKIQKKIENKND
jgi:chorismate mutase/prephenate dehydratase